MIKKNMMIRMGAMVLAGVLLICSAITAFADPAGQDGQAANSPDIEKDIDNSDVIDISKDGSLTIYKYDFTSAGEAGAYSTSGGVNSTGKADSALQSALAEYAIKGVEFTYLWVGDIEQYSSGNGSGTQVNLVYEIPESLAAILGLADEDGYVLRAGDSGVIVTGAIDMDLAATDMTDANVVSQTCNKAGYLHYTSDQINLALKNLLDADNVLAKNALEEYVISLHDDSEDNVTAGTDDTIINDHTKSHTLVETDSNGYTYVNGLDLGLYLIVETAVPENVTETVNPFFISVPMTDETAYQYTIDDDGNVEYTLDSEGDKIPVEEGGNAWFYDIVAYPKNQTGNPTLDKMVRSADDEEEYASTTTASAGDTLDYIIVSKLPHITSSTTFLTQYVFEDCLSAGLTYNDDVKIAFYSNADDANSNDTTKAVSIWTWRKADGVTYNTGNGGTTDGYYAVTYSQIETGKDLGKTKLMVEITGDGLALINGDGSDGYSDYYIVVYYSVEVSSDSSLVLGDAGNPNDVTLTWSRSNMSYYDTLDDECIVYAYGIDLTKEFSDGNGNYADVTFNLYNRTDGYYVTADYNKDDGAYYVTGKSNLQDGAAVFAVNDNGKLIILGLEANVYGLAELSTSSGYSLLADEITIDIASASSIIQAEIAGWTGQNYAASNAGDNIGGKIAMVIGELTKGSATADGVKAAMLSDSYNSFGEDAQSVLDAVAAESENAIVRLAITNTADFTLPLTGGAGLYIITIAGVAAVAAGCYFAFGRNKEGKKGSKTGMD